jgi:DNA-binding transcriptional ArsR family regulator
MQCRTQTHTCGVTDGNIDQQVREDLIGEEVAQELAQLLKTLGDPNRLRIISLLRHHELCVHDIVELVGLSQSAVSHQLRTLRQMRLVHVRKEGRNVYYTLDDEHVHDLFELSLEHLLND